MTGEQLVATSTEKLEAMTDEELLAWVTPILQFTRPALENILPEPVKPPKVKKEKKPKAPKEEPKQLTIEEILAQMTKMKEEQESE